MKPTITSERGTVLRVGFWHNRFFADSYFGAAGFFSRISSPDFFASSLWEKCPEKSSRKISSKILPNLHNKNPRHISAEGPGQQFTQLQGSLATRRYRTPFPVLCHRFALQPQLQGSLFSLQGWGGVFFDCLIVAGGPRKVKILRAARLQNGTAPEKCLNRYEKWFVKTRKRIRKRIRKI